MKKIISWNVNGIRAVEKKGFIDWLLGCGADVVCIQETKANPGQLSPELLAPGGVYKSYFSSAKRPGYSGTAIFTKTEPDSVETMGDGRFDDEGRVTIAKYGKLAVISAYFPNSQDAGARLDYKLAFCEEPKQYTWWSYRFHAREKNIGWRIDYQCVNPSFIDKVKSSVILADVLGSDHCPIAVEVE